MSRPFHVIYANVACAYIRGRGPRELLMELRGGRAPVWLSLGRGWVVQPHTASDFMAVAVARGRLVVVSQDDSLPAARGLLW